MRYALLMLLVILFSANIEADDKFAPGTAVNILGLTGHMYKFKVPGYADNSKYTVSFPYFSEVSLSAGSDTSSYSSDVTGISASRHPSAEAIVNLCNCPNCLDYGLAQIVNVDGYTSCLVISPSFSEHIITTSNSYSGTSHSAQRYFAIPASLNIMIDALTLVQLHTNFQIIEHQSPSQGYDMSTSNLYLNEGGIVPDNESISYAVEEVKKVIDYIGITKVN